MSVIPITVFLSLLLAATFVVLFVRDHRRRRFASAERDSLLPLADETPHVLVEADVDQINARAREPEAEPEHAHDHEHAHDDEPDHDHHRAQDGGPCGCRTGLRPPCVGCLRRREGSLRPQT